MTKRKITQMSEVFSSDSIKDSDIFTYVDVDHQDLDRRNKKVKVSVLKELFGEEGQGGRIQLLQDVTFYVSTNGNDNNNGLSKTTPFQTVKHALKHIESLDLNGFNVDLEIEPGNYVDEGTIHLPLLVGAKSETCLFGPPLEPGIPVVEPEDLPNAQLNIGPYEFRNGIPGKQSPVYLPQIEADHFGYYSLNNITIRYTSFGGFAI